MLSDITASIGSVGDYDNALAEATIGLFKTEVVRRHRPFKTLDDVEYATFEWGRLVTTTGCTPPWTTGHPPNTKPTTTLTRRAKRPTSQPEVSNEPGPVQFNDKTIAGRQEVRFQVRVTNSQAERAEMTTVNRAGNAGEC